MSEALDRKERAEEVNHLFASLNSQERKIARRMYRRMRRTVSSDAGQTRLITRYYVMEDYVKPAMLRPWR